MRRPFFAANWKMFKTIGEAVAWGRTFRELTRDLGDRDLVAAPPFTALAAFAAEVKGSNVAVASQDVFFEKEGAFTGAISAAMVADTGATYAIVGHSERRRIFGDTDASVNRKARTAIANGLIPIVCIGETLEEREANQTLDVLDRQIKDGLDSITGDQVAALVLAYEPVWAIGTGRNATPTQAGEAHAHIRSRIRQWFGADAADKVRILYGGSVKPDNIGELRQQPDVDGALVGGASLDPASFFAIASRG